MDISDDNDMVDGGNASSGMDIVDDTGTYQGIDGDAGGYGWVIWGEVACKESTNLYVKIRFFSTRTAELLDGSC